MTREPVGRPRTADDTPAAARVRSRDDRAKAMRANALGTAIEDAIERAADRLVDRLDRFFGERQAAR